MIFVVPPPHAVRAFLRRVRVGMTPPTAVHLPRDLRVPYTRIAHRLERSRRKPRVLLPRKLQVHSNCRTVLGRLAHALRARQQVRMPAQDQHMHGIAFFRNLTVASPRSAIRENFTKSGTDDDHLDLPFEGCPFVAIIAPFASVDMIVASSV
ncbi:hypothetical protein CALCODRAFT_319541 [Calocera cornea HHB12733]|uniref:Uncharacterized protein n=1 Tax=Calocera cornea HHB12733 TaxID=1353952 RepID=A0A165F7I5_9BASI|nr:hypothetical protein CALCODRAFT_319541 [Calocera cornea HHB12733]